MISQATEFWIGGFSLDALNISLHSLLVCMVSAENLENLDIILCFSIEKLFLSSSFFQDFIFDFL